MIQFNLLPDVKLEYVRAQRTKHTVVSVALIAAGSAFALFLLLFMAVHVAQRKNLNDLNGDIKQYSTELKDTTDLDKILTIQNQLGALTGLHQGKPAAGRVFTFIAQVVPPNVSLADFDADFTQHTIKITGQAPSLDNVNTLVDTLKFTTFSTKEVSGQKAFSGVVLSQFTRSGTGATFDVTTNFDPAIFNNASDVTLSIPNRVSTPSVVGQPANVFTKTPTNGAKQ